MISKNTVVLKFGSSIFAGPANYAQAVIEIRRYLNDGQKVVAIVSAMLGETDKLLRWGRTVNPAPDAYTLSELVASGELQSACLLSLALQAEQVRSVVAKPQQIALLAEGPPTDSDPCSMDVGKLQDMLAQDDVVIIPGFIGHDSSGRTVLFGRGGSDDTALFVAHQLGADCILLKDVDGVFEYDPALPGTPPQVFTHISWDHALEVAGVLVQAKAIRFARQRNLTFAVRSIGSTAGTWIGPRQSQLVPMVAATG